MAVYRTTRRLSWYRAAAEANAPGVITCMLFTTAITDGATTPTGTQANRFDENGANPVTGTFNSDAAGQVNMYLEPGEYWIAGLFAGIWRTHRFEVCGCDACDLLIPRHRTGALADSTLNTDTTVDVGTINIPALCTTEELVLRVNGTLCVTT